MQRNRLKILLFRSAGILAFPVLIMHAYADYRIFSIFGGTLHTFVKYTLPSIPYYIFWLGLFIASLKKWWAFLWLAPIFAFLVLRIEGVYLYKIIFNPNIITLPYLTYLAILASAVVILATITWIFWLVKK